MKPGSMKCIWFVSNYQVDISFLKHPRRLAVQVHGLRKYKKKIIDKFKTSQILSFVSDRAKALIHLATVKYKVNSVADLFHFKYCINSLLTLALAAKIRSTKANFEKTNQKTNELIINETEYTKMQFMVDNYVEEVQNITHIVHPFYEGTKKNSSERTSNELINELDKIKEIILECKITDKNFLINKAEYLCRLFQRTSSQVEGRNGYLSMMNHTQRGFDKQRLNVLTVIHNFDIRSYDNLTPAERLFGIEKNDISIFDFLMENISELPYPRNRNKIYIDY